jgi:O-antigen ligase
LIQLSFWGVGVQFSEGLATFGLIGCVAGVAWALSNTGGGSSWTEVAKGWWPILALLCWWLIAPALSGRWPTGAGLARAADWLTIPIAAFAFRSLEPRQRTIFALACGGMLLLSCGIAALQHFGAWPEPAAFSRLGWTRIPFQRVYERAPGTTDRFMVGGLFFHRLKFAHVEGLAVLVALSWAFHTEGWLRLFSASLAAIGLVSVLVFPYARAAAVALVLTALASALWLQWRRTGVRVAAAAIAVGFAIILASQRPLRERFLSAATDSGSGNRRGMLQAGFAAVRAHPIVGIGLGQFRPSKFAPPNAPEEVLIHPGKAHNQFVTVAAEAGIPALLLFCLVLAWLGSAMELRRPEGAAGASALLFFVLLSLFHDPLYHGEFSMALMLTLGSALTYKEDALLAMARIPMSRR